MSNAEAYEQGQYRPGMTYTPDPDPPGSIRVPGYPYAVRPEKDSEGLWVDAKYHCTAVERVTDFWRR